MHRVIMGKVEPDVVHVPDLFLHDFRTFPSRADTTLVIQRDGVVFDGSDRGFDVLYEEVTSIETLSIG